MNDTFEMTTGLAHEIAMAMRRNGWTVPDAKKLTEGDTLARLLPFLKGNAEIKTVKHVIDCDADPYLPDGWKVEEHRKGGQVEFDLSKVTLYLVKDQQCGGVIEGNKLRKQLAKQPVFNANVLDYLLKNPALIPDEWKGKAIFFWGTVYRDSLGGLYVRYLLWRGSSWGWSHYWLDNGWYDGYPALCPQVSA